MGLICVLAICSGISKAEASTYLGELCWQTDVTASPGTPDIIKLAVTNMGDLHYILNGEELNSTGDSNNIVFHGNAEIIGSSLIFTLNGSFDGTDDVTGNNVTDSMTMNVNLSTSTLNGTYNEIEHTYNKSTSTLTTEHESGTATLVTCP